MYFNTSSLKYYKFIEQQRHQNQQSVSNSTTEIIHQIIQQMEDAPQHWDIAPDITTYNSLLYDTSLKNYKQAASDCESLLRHMKHLTKGQVDTISCIFITAYTLV